MASAECFWNRKCGEVDETTRNEHTLKAVGNVEGLGLGRTGGDLGEEVIQMGKVTKIGQELAKRNSVQGCYSLLLEFYCRFFKKSNTGKENKRLMFCI